MRISPSISATPANRSAWSFRSPDEFPYLAKSAPELPSVLQAMVDAPAPQLRRRPWFALGWFFAQGRAGEAVRCFRRGLCYAPGDARIHENLGTALASLGSGEAAAQSFSEALRLDPGAADARAALERLRRRHRIPSER